MPFTQEHILNTDVAQMRETRVEPGSTSMTDVVSMLAIVTLGLAILVIGLFMVCHLIVYCHGYYQQVVNWIENRQQRHQDILLPRESRDPEAIPLQSTNNIRPLLTTSEGDQAAGGGNLTSRSDSWESLPPTYEEAMGLPPREPAPTTSQTTRTTVQQVSERQTPRRVEIISNMNRHYIVNGQHTIPRSTPAANTGAISRTGHTQLRFDDDEVGPPEVGCMEAVCMPCIMIMNCCCG